MGQKLRANAGKNQKSGYMGVFKNIFFGDLYWSTTEWTLNPKYYPEISSGLDFAALGSSDFSKNDFFQKIKEKTTVTWFFNQISWFLEVLQVLAWIFEKKLWKKIWGQNLPVLINYSCFHCLQKWPPAELRTKIFGAYYIPLER